MTIHQPASTSSAPARDDNTASLETALARLENWLETMRGPGGYGGPVAHWWQQSLLYTGPGLDWRYEGIITGYLNLWERTGLTEWLAKARRAGDDLRAGQLADGHYRASAFELNPASGGTPHEAAADCGLLRLAAVLRRAGDSDWMLYGQTARRNLTGYYLGQLWDGEAASFRDSPGQPSFVPNKAATACEALMELADLTGEAELVERYVRPNLDRIIEHQLDRTGGRLAGAVAQNSFGPTRRVEKYFPLYNARCVPALVRGYELTGQARYLAAAQAIVKWIATQVRPDGALPTVVYADGSASYNPVWLAGLGDVLYAAHLLRSHTDTPDLALTRQYWLSGQTGAGSFQTGRGFGGQARLRSKDRPDLRDWLGVVGWCDKSFRYLTSQTHLAGPPPPAPTDYSWEVEGWFGGRQWTMLETADRLEIRPAGTAQPAYLWQKGEERPRLAAPEFWLR